MRIAGAILISVFFLPFASAQRYQGLMSEQQHVLPPVAFESVQFAGKDSSRGTVYFFYRINKAFFSFVHGESSQQDFYSARGEFSVECIDQKATVASHQYRSIQLSRHQQSDISGDAVDIQGMFTFSLPPAKYTVVVECKDLESERDFINRDKALDVNLIRPDSLFLSTPIFCMPHRDTADHEAPSWSLLNRGSTISFASSGGVILQINSHVPEDSLTLSWTLRRHSRDENDTVSFKGTGYSSIGSNLDFQEKNDSVVVLPLKNMFSGYFIYIPLPLRMLEPGEYRLSIAATAGHVHKENNTPFRVTWFNKPASLSDTHIVINALRYIATEDEIDNMSSSVGSKGWKNFIEFWKRRSPDTTQAFNPVMAEYYRRVDEAMRKFSTDDIPEGYRTDRGRILILLGTPTKTERKFRPNTDPTEIWTYEHLHKRFIFTDPQHISNYALKKAEDF